MLRTMKPRLILFSKEVLEEVGFYATRFVEADDEEEATLAVFRIIEAECSENAVSSTSKSSLELNKIIVDEKGFDAHAPGSGFTFYDEGDDAAEQ